MVYMSDHMGRLYGTGRSAMVPDGGRPKVAPTARGGRWRGKGGRGKPLPYGAGRTLAQIAGDRRSPLRGRNEHLTAPGNARQTRARRRRAMPGATGAGRTLARVGSDPLIAPQTGCRGCQPLQRWMQRRRRTAGRVAERDKPLPYGAGRTFAQIAGDRRSPLRRKMERGRFVKRPYGGGRDAGAS